MEMFNTLNIVLAVVILACSIRHYKSLYNPIGVYSFMWLVILYFYNMKLSYILSDLSLSTYFFVYLSIILFGLGCLMQTKKNYQTPAYRPTEQVHLKKLYILYFCLFSIAILEMFIKTPPLLAVDKIKAYMEPAVPLLHFSIVLLPLTYGFILQSKLAGKKSKIILIIPPTVILLLWMQRGILISFVLMTLVIAADGKSVKQQLTAVALIALVMVMLVNLLGTLRSSKTGDYVEDYINNVSLMKKSIPSYLVWPYIYPTSSLNNFNQVINNKNLDILMGYGLIEPLLSVTQFKRAVNLVFDLQSADDEEITDFEVIQGMNTPTYFYWCFKNLSYLGLILMPFVLGSISQFLFNSYRTGSLRHTMIFSIWFPNIFYSFHDFLFWNSGFILSLCVIWFLTTHIYFINKKAPLAGLL